MSVPLYLVLIVVVWCVAIVGMKRDYDKGGWAAGAGAVVFFLCAVIVTLLILLSRARWGWP